MLAKCLLDNISDIQIEVETYLKIYPLSLCLSPKEANPLYSEQAGVRSCSTLVIIRGVWNEPI